MNRRSFTGACAGALLCCAAALLGGCGVSEAPKFRATDITGAPYAQDFRLADPQGRVRTLADFRGKAVTIFFGYTQCPDVCPTTLSTMKAVMARLGPEADRTQVLFVTVDPERDSAQLLAEYVPAFDRRFLGLRAEPGAATAAVMKDYRIYASKQGDVAAGTYTVDHSAGMYAYDPQGRLRLYIRHGAPADDIAADLKQLLAGK